MGLLQQQQQQHQHAYDDWQTAMGFSIVVQGDALEFGKECKQE
jgi:hypothetical protein